MAYQYGQQVRLKGVFTNEAGEPKDPTTVTVKVQTPDGTQNTYLDAVRDSEGHWHKDITLAKPASGNGGQLVYRFEGAGTLIAANETNVGIEQSVF